MKRQNWDPKHWTRLDLDRQTTWQAWFGRARRFLIAGDRKIEALLDWLERYDQDAAPLHGPKAEEAERGALEEGGRLLRVGRLPSVPGAGGRDCPHR